MLLCPDIFSTGLSGAESGNIKVGDAVAVFAQGPIGLCATLGAKLKGASLIIGIDANGERLEVARRFGANVTLNINDGDPVPEIKRLTEGRGVDVAIEALGRQETFEAALRSLRPGGTLSSLGVYSGKLVAPYEAIYAGLGDQKIVTTLCPGGKERMRRLMAMVANRRVDLVAARDAPLLVRSDRRGDRSVQQPARRRAEGRAASGGAAVAGAPGAGGRRRRRDLLNGMAAAGVLNRRRRARLNGTACQKRSHTGHGHGHGQRVVTFS